MMSESESALTDAEHSPASPLQTFAAKTAIVTVAILVILYGAASLVTSSIDEYTEVLKGGPTFWGTLEGKLYKLADEPDLPPEKKKRILDALRKLSVKYKPYLDAASPENSVNQPKY
jgi:hypothetical protein